MKRILTKRPLNIILFSLFFTVSAYSQEDYTAQHQLHSQLTSELDGVFQIQMIGIRTQPMIDTELLKRIKLEQKDNEIFSFYHTSDIRIIIKSKTDVAQGRLFTEEEIISYINE